jgi:hypothetical protein
MAIIVIIILVCVIIFIIAMNRGVRFEEECAERIQQNHNRLSQEPMNIGEARLVLRTIVDALNRVNAASPSPKLISLRKARLAAVAIHQLTLTGMDPSEATAEYYERL